MSIIFHNFVLALYSELFDSGVSTQRYDYYIYCTSILTFIFQQIDPAPSGRRATTLFTSKGLDWHYKISYICHSKILLFAF